MRKRKLGTLTIGQAPRSDITPILEREIGGAVEVLHRGVLDGMTLAQVEQAFGPRPGEALLATRLLDGTPVRLSKAAVQARMGRGIEQLEEDGCDLVLILCTGAFEGMQAKRAWLLEPDRIVPPTVAALAGKRRAGILVPLPEQAQSEHHKWHALARAPLYAAASPYAPDCIDQVRAAARALKDRGAELIVMDCIGYAWRHRDAARETTDLPVVLSNSIVAKLATTLL